MIISLFVALSFLSLQKTDNFSKAIELYDSGMYERARTLFESCENDSDASDYIVLCAINMGSADCPILVNKADIDRPSSVFNSEIHRLYALTLFEKGQYDYCLDNLDKVAFKDLSDSQAGEYWYKKAYCISALSDNTEDSIVYFLKSAEYQTEYTYPALFAIGILEYRRMDFISASKWFEKSSEDPRFSDISAFYLVDCHFMLHDYDYVIKKGESIFNDMPPVRQTHLSRILSEAYMLKGDAKNAKKYLSDGEEMTDVDYFHAGSVLYSLGDYAGAIRNFDKMKQKGDSLYQSASYQKAYSYIKLKNKVSALDCFKVASELSFDKEISEDALFNYAKLSFDLNGDESVFSRYMSKYGTSVKGEMIYDYLAISALARKDYSKAVEAYDNIDELSPLQKSNYIKANFQRAQQLLDIGSYSASITYLKSAAYYLSKSDEFGQLCRYILANTYYTIDSYKDALNVYNDLYNLSALDDKPEGALIPYNIAYCFFKQKDYNNAARWFDIYIASSDRLAREDALIRKADCLFSVKDYRNAAAGYKKAVSEYPHMDNLYPFYYMGMAYGLDGKKVEKVNALKSVLNAEPVAPYYNQSLYELGRAYSEVSDSGDALKVFDMLLTNTSDPEFTAKALSGKGMVKRNTGDLDGALSDYKLLVRKLPKSPYVQEALLSIQSIYTSLKQPEKYIEYLEANNLSVGKTKEERMALYFGTAEQVFLAGNYKGAIQSFEKYLNLYPDCSNSSDVYYYIAASYKSMSQKEKACEYYKKALDSGLSGSFEEFAVMDYALLSDALQNYELAYDLYMRLSDGKYEMTSMADALKGAMRAAYKSQMYNKAITAASSLLKLTNNADLRREAQYIQAKSYLSTSQREKAFELLTKLMSEADTPEGAESYYLVIKSRYDWGKFELVESGVFDFAEKNTHYPYWLAKAFIVLGDSYVERNMMEQAIATYQSVKDGYEPSSEGDDIIQIVNQKLSELQ